ncbi:MAG: hypothetical protein QXK65_03055, partial [Candidatus Micrarchaeaceae archaeon]
MGSYKAIAQTFREEYKARNDLYKSRLVKWGTEPTVTRISRPTNLARARTLGYKAMEGVLMARVRVLKGKRKRAQAGGGRKPS